MFAMFSYIFSVAHVLFLWAAYGPDTQRPRLVQPAMRHAHRRRGRNQSCREPPSA